MEDIDRVNNRAGASARQRRSPAVRSHRAPPLSVKKPRATLQSTIVHAKQESSCSHLSNPFRRLTCRTHARRCRRAVRVPQRRRRQLGACREPIATEIVPMIATSALHVPGAEVYQPYDLRAASVFERFARQGQHRRPSRGAPVAATVRRRCDESRRRARHQHRGAERSRLRACLDSCCHLRCRHHVANVGSRHTACGLTGPPRPWQASRWTPQPLSLRPSAVRRRCIMARARRRAGAPCRRQRCSRQPAPAPLGGSRGVHSHLQRSLL